MSTMSEQKVYEFLGRKVRARLEPQKLLTMAKVNLVALEQQEAYLFKLQLERMPCVHPDCSARCSQLEAFTGEVFEIGAVKDTFECPACKTPLRLIVPLMGPAWQWVKAPKT